MNANELAETLENKDRLWAVDENLMIKTCAMLRQQEAEIEQLKYDLAVNENYLLLERQYNEKLWKQLNPTEKAQLK